MLNEDELITAMEHERHRGLKIFDAAAPRMRATASPGGSGLQGLLRLIDPDAQ